MLFLPLFLLTIAKMNGLFPRVRISFIQIEFSCWSAPPLFIGFDFLNVRAKLTRNFTEVA